MTEDKVTIISEIDRQKKLRNAVRKFLNKEIDKEELDRLYEEILQKEEEVEHAMR